jgi:hypothetical protein
VKSPNVYAVEVEVEDETPVVDNSKKKNKSNDNKVVKVDASKLESTPFKNSDEGNKFRKYVHDYHPKIAKQYDLDLTNTAYNNSTMKKVWNELKDSYLQYQKNVSGSSSTTYGLDQQKKIIDDEVNAGTISNGKAWTIEVKQLDRYGMSEYKYAYVKVYDVDRDGNGMVTKINDDGKPPVGTPTYSNDTLVVLFFYDFTWGYLDKSGTVNTANHTLTWEKGSPKVKFGEAIKKKHIFEQVIDWSTFLSSGQKSSSNVSGSGSVSSDLSTKDEPLSRKDELRTMFGFVDANGNTYKPDVLIKKMNLFPEVGVSGKGSIQRAINKRGAKSYYFEEFNELMNLENLTDYVLTYPSDYSVKEYQSQEIDTDNSAGLAPSEDDLTNTQITKETFGNYLGTDSKLEIYINKGQSQTIKSSPIISQYNEQECKQKLIDWLRFGFKADYKSTPNRNELKEMCACYKDGNFDKLKETGLTQEELKISSSLLRFGKFFNKVLSWNEIEKLIRGEEVRGKEFYPLFVDENFGNDICLATFSESISKKVKRKITETIKSKKKTVIKGNIVESVLLNIKERL